MVASLALKQGGLDTPALTGELFAINADGSHQIDLFGYRSSAMAAASKSTFAAATPISEEPLNETQLLISVDAFTRDANGSTTDIEKINVMNGHTSSLGSAPASGAQLVADHAGQVRAATASTDFLGNKLWLRASNDATWELANDPAQSHVVIEPIGFNRDNSKLYARVSDAGRPDAIELMDVATRQRTRLFQGAFADPGELLSTPDKQDYYAVIGRDGVPVLHYFDENIHEAMLSAGLAANFPGQLAYFSHFTSDGKLAIVHVASDRNPGDYYYFDLATHNAKYLVGAEHWINPKHMLAMQPITLNARDGLTLHGFLTLPTGPKPYPLIVLPHGGPHGIMDAWGYDSEVQLFASRGYAVLQVNYRGSGGYGSKFQQRGYRQWGLSMQDDLTDATQWAVSQGYADSKRLCIYGASYGGYAALEGVVREPDLYKCAIGYAGVYDLRVQLDESDTHRSYRGMAYLKRVLGEDRDDLLHRSPLGGVDRIKANILLIHGEADPRVPFENFREFTHALDKRKISYQSLTEPDEGHGFFLEAHKLVAYQKMLDFLAQNIGTPATAAH